MTGRTRTLAVAAALVGLALTGARAAMTAPR